MQWPCCQEVFSFWLCAGSSGPCSESPTPWYLCHTSAEPWDVERDLGT